MTGTDIRKLVIEMHHRAGQGHIGCSLSIADMVAAINPGGENAPVFILSKGHAASALYAALHLNGHIKRDELFTFCQPGSRLQAHPEANIPHVPLATGSLGMGLSMGCGLALAKPESKIVVLISDAELNEGSTWEAVMFAGHHELNNLWLFVDHNHQQALGRSVNILEIKSLWSVLNGFGWSCYFGNGHDLEQMQDWLSGKRSQAWDDQSHKPQVYVADTIFGKGVDFMHADVSWHYRVMNQHEYIHANALLQCAGSRDLEIASTTCAKNS